MHFIKIHYPIQLFDDMIALFRLYHYYFFNIRNFVCKRNFFELELRVKDYLKTLIFLRDVIAKTLNRSTCDDVHKCFT